MATQFSLFDDTYLRVNPGIFSHPCRASGKKSEIKSFSEKLKYPRQKILATALLSNFKIQLKFSNTASKFQA